MYKAFAYGSYLVAAACAGAAFYAYPYAYVPAAVGFGYLGYKLYKRSY